jgi:hypothetical protein
MDCPTCKHAVPIPAPHAVLAGTDGTMDSFPPGILSLEVRFLCSSCRCKVQIDARWEGRVIACPKCHKPNTVPRWSRRPSVGVTLSEEEVDFLTGPNDESQSQTA